MPKEKGKTTKSTGKKGSGKFGRIQGRIFRRTERLGVPRMARSGTVVRMSMGGACVHEEDARSTSTTQ